MPKFSKKSLDRLAQLDPALQSILHVAIKYGPDFTILTGHRRRREQEEAVRKGLSRVHWPNGKHNSLPSTAVDIAPWPIDWGEGKSRPARETQEAINRFRRLCSFIMGVAVGMGVELRWGGDWDRDWSELDEKGLRDFGHLEIFRKLDTPVLPQTETTEDKDLLELREQMAAPVGMKVLREGVAELLRRVYRLETRRT